MNPENGDNGCYCSGPRELGTVELLCGKCANWFHKRCLGFRSLKCIPFMVNYSFICKSCNSTDHETFIPKQANFSQMCITALANLTCAHMKQGKTMFSKDKDIIPYIDAHWEGLTSMSRRVKQTWHQTVMKTMLKESEVFTRATISDSSVYGGFSLLFGLVEQDLTKIGPTYEMSQIGKSSAAVKNNSKDAAATSVATDRTAACGNAVAGGSNSHAFDDEAIATDGFLPPPSVLPKTRSAKRKNEQQVNVSTLKKVKSCGESTLSKLSAYGLPIDHPFNRDGYRYFLAEMDMHAPNRQEFDDSNDTAGKPIPPYIYRAVRLNAVILSSNDRAPQLKLSDDRLQVSGEKGYSVIRATHGVSRGSWYFEVTLIDQPDQSHTRIGWSQSLGCLQAPVGYDKFSYSWRSRKGTRFHDSLGRHYSDGYKQGDVLGFYISLPDDGDVSKHLPSTCKDLPLIKFKSHLYYEEKDEVQKTLASLRPLKGSRICFYKNGINQGVAYTDIYDATYFPAISLYKNATVKANFGPNFQFPPKDVDFRPMIEQAQEFQIEQTVADMLFFVENEGKLTLDA